MKWIAFCVFVFICLSAVADPQSQTFEHRWAGWADHAYLSPDGTRLWTVEDGGRIHYRDPNNTWSYQTVPSSVKDPLHGIHFVGDAGWAVGEDGWVLHTVNGGTTWTALFQMPNPAKPTQNETMYDVQFLDDATTGWLVGEHGAWYTDATIPGGGLTAASWYPVLLVDAAGGLLDMSNVELYKIDVVPRTAGVLALMVGQPGYILRNVDPQAHVFQVVFDVHSLCGSLSGCEAGLCAPANNVFEMWDVDISRNTNPSMRLALADGGIGGGCGMMFSSVDDGLTWTKEFHECQLPGSMCAGDPLYNDNTSIVTDTWRHQAFKTLYGVAIFDGDNSAVASGYNGQHVIRNPANGVWQDRSSFSNKPLDAMGAVIFPLYGAVADLGSSTAGGLAELIGSGGHARRSTSVLTTWADDLVGNPWRITDAFFVTDQIGWQVGQFLRIAQTTDGGIHWLPQPSTAALGSLSLKSVVVDPTMTSGVSVGAPDGRPGNFQDAPKILRMFTSGSSTSWIEPLNISTLPAAKVLTKTLQCVKWVTGQEFWCVGDSALIFRTQDGGVNWTQMADPSLPIWKFQSQNLLSLAFMNSLNGVFVGTIPASPPNMTRSVALSYKDNGGGGTWTDISPANSDITVMADVEVHGTTAYAVGEKLVGGSRFGVVLKSDYIANAFSQFVEMTPQPVVPACTIGGDLDRVPVLNRVAINATTGDIWTGGECGRVWRYTTTGGWAQLKSQTSSHVQGMSITPGGYVYLGCYRQSGEQECIVRWHP
jgi:photosystem II stability/assembly factor-like uncharacterized protein